MDNNNMMNNGDNMQFDPNNQFNNMGAQTQSDPNSRFNNMGAQTQFDPNNQFNSMGSQQYSYNAYDQGVFQPYQESIYKQPGESGGVDGKAIASLVCGIIGILLCCCYGIPAILLGVIAIVLAMLSRRDNMGRFPGLAVGGLICGIVAVVAGFIFIICMIVGIAQEL